jgi:four helix bundle protein
VNADELRKRTQAVALKIITFVQSLPRQESATILGRQLLRCGTSVGANYRAACRARSRADFIAKPKIIEEECDESVYWMELLSAAKIGYTEQVSTLLAEADEILSIIFASIRTARAATD